MATYKKTTKGWQAQVCVSGYRKAKTFSTKTEARRWAAAQELAQHGEIPPEGRMTLLEAAVMRERLRRAPAAAKTECTIRGSGLSEKKLCAITARDIESCRDKLQERMTPVSASRYLADVKAVLSWAHKKHWIPEDPGRGVTVAGAQKQRDRVPTAEEFDALCVAAGWREGELPETLDALTVAAFRMSMLTGMRGGEILAIEQSWIDGSVIHLPAAATKARRARDVALGPAAKRLLDMIVGMGFRPRVWGLSASAKIEHFGDIRARAGLGEVIDSEGRVVREALHFHDARAYFVTWCAQHGVGIAECCRQVGHSSTKMLMRYYRGSAADLVAKLL